MQQRDNLRHSETHPLFAFWVNNRNDSLVSCGIDHNLRFTGQLGVLQSNRIT